MKHLTFDEILDFISFERLDENTLNLASRVNGHITECKECFDLVNSFQLINDEFNELGKTEDFAQFAKERYKKSQNAAELKTKFTQKQ